MDGGLKALARHKRPRFGEHQALLPTLAAIVLAESLLYVDRLQLALWVHLLTLLALLSAPLFAEADTELLAALSLVPLFRLVNLGMPTFVELTLVWFPLVYWTVLPAIYLVARTAGVEVRWGFRTAARWLPVAVPVSALLALTEYAIIRPDALVAAWRLADLLFVAGVMLFAIGLVEELLYRGVLQPVAVAHLGRRTGLLLQAALFGIAHSVYGTPVEVAFAGVLGFAYGLVYERTDSMALIVLLHGVLNTFLFGVVPLQPDWFPLVG